MSRIDFEDYFLRELKEKFENREFAIPEIQRQFVWDKKKICNLMDSIFRNYPIGISLVWNAPLSKSIHIRPNTKTIIPPFNRRINKHDLIIDGQQRLSTLYGILNGIQSKPEAGSNINFKELFFDCDRKSSARFLFSKKLDENSRGYIRLTDLLNTKPALLKKRLKLPKWASLEADRCYYAFHSYRFYLLKFDGLDFDDVKEVFIRINSGGMKVSRADTLFARATNVNLRDHMLDTRRGLKNGFDAIPVDSLQNTLALAYGATQLGGKGLQAFLKKIEKNKKSNKEFHKTWKKLQYGYEEAVDFLVAHLHVKNFKLLPSQNIYSILAYFFFLNQSKVKPNQLKEIRKWFWHTCCGERYSGAGFNRNIPADIAFFKRLAQSKEVKYPVTEKINALDFLKSNYRSAAGSTSTNAYFIMLRTKKPKYLINGHEMLLDDVSSISNRKDRHHVYPSALLRRHQVNVKWINCIANICYLEADENQSIGDEHPRKYLLNYKKAKHFHRVMKGHLIPCSAKNSVWQDNVKKSFLSFLNQRGKIVINEIENLAGTRIFQKFEELKRL